MKSNSFIDNWIQNAIGVENFLKNQYIKLQERKRKQNPKYYLGSGATGNFLQKQYKLLTSKPTVNKPVAKSKQSEVNPEIIKFIKNQEKFSPTVYKDGKGIPTIGYGFTKKKYLNMAPMSKAQADSIFSKEIINYQNEAKQQIPQYNSLPENLKQILTSYVYNAGSVGPKFKDAVSNQDWNKAIKELDAGYNDTIKNPGLRTRRTREQYFAHNGRFPDEYYKEYRINK